MIKLKRFNKQQSGNSNGKYYGNSARSFAENSGEVIASIKETQKQIEEKRGQLLTLQTRISEQETRINDTLATIKEVRDKALTNLFVQDSPAIWNVQRRTDSTGTLYQETENTFTTQAAALNEYFRRQSRRICSARNHFSRFCRRVILGAAAHAPVCRKRTGTRTRRYRFSNCRLRRL